MGLKYVCDICKKNIEKYVRVTSSMEMYCKKCWLDKKNWEKIHKTAVKNSRL